MYSIFKSSGLVKNAAEHSRINDGPHSIDVILKTQKHATAIR